MKVEPFKAEHYAAMTLRREDPAEIEEYGGMLRYVQKYETAGPGYTLFTDDNRIVGSGGVVLTWKGNAEAWSILTELVPLYPKTVYKTWRDLLEVIIRDYSLHRVQATCRFDHPTARPWLERLGFVFEGVLKKYGADGADHLMFGRTV